MALSISSCKYTKLSTEQQINICRKISRRFRYETTGLLTSGA